MPGPDRANVLIYGRALTLKAPITTIVVCFAFCWLKVTSANSVDTDQTAPKDPDQTLIWVHTVCLYAKIGLKSLQEYSADDINRWHFQMQVFLAL